MLRVRRRSSGEVELASQWEDLHALLEQAEAELTDALQRQQHQALVARLEAQGLPPADHEALIRLELERGWPLHPEPAHCPACKGSLAEEAGNKVRCGRSGQGGDYCRHTDEENLYRCGRCGKIARALDRRRGKIYRDDPLEPDLAKVERGRCPLCGGSVADWSRHFFRCPKGSGDQFPRCPVCTKRGFHQRVVRCPRCDDTLTTLACME